jgi:hypothetical protein
MHMQRWVIGIAFGLFATVFVTALTTVSLAQTITAQNWQTHPAIREIRALYQEANTLIARGALRRSHLEPNCLGTSDLERTLYTDRNGRPRRYIFAAGGDDSTITFEHTYDASGRLRFAFIRAAAVNETVKEERLYFKPDGKLLWTDFRTVKGPGWAWDWEQVRASIVRNPKAAFAAKPACRP